MIILEMEKESEVTRKRTSAMEYEALFGHQVRITGENNKKPQEILSAVTSGSRKFPSANSYQPVTYGSFIGYGAQTVSLNR